MARKKAVQPPTPRPKNKPAKRVVDHLLHSLEVITDPRMDRGKRYPLREILAIGVIACVCGCDDAESIEDWASKEEEWLSRFLPLQHGTPSQDTFLRVFAALDPKAFQKAFLSWVQAVFSDSGINVQVAIDGQTNRGSRKGKKRPIHMVSALTCGEGLVLGQIKTDEKSNEITAIPDLLEVLDLREALVSIDAMGCQVSIARLILKREGHYLLGLKSNQPSLLEEVISAFEATDGPVHHNVDQAQPPMVTNATEVDKGHGRLETRTASVMEYSPDWVPAGARWPDLQSLVRIQSVTEDLVSGATRTETRYAISSRKLTAAEANTHVRSHWLVESQLHWCLDVTFGQDGNQTCTDNAAENLAVMRHFALNVIRSYEGDRNSVPRRRRLCDYRMDYREVMLGL